MGWRPPTKALLVAVTVLAVAVSVSPVLGQEAAEDENLSSGRQFRIGGEAFMPTLTVAYLSGRFWASESVGIDGGAGAISIPCAATFPGLHGSQLYKSVCGDL